MGRKALISDAVHAVVLKIVRSRPDDMQSVTTSQVMAHDDIINARLSAKQIESALELLRRNEKLVDLGAGTYRVILPKTPMEGRPVPKALQQHKVSGEGIFFWQMNEMLFGRLSAC